MPEPTLAEVFGAGANQTATHLNIAKADLPGLTASANNTAESLFVGIILKAMGTTDPAVGLNSTAQGDDPLRQIAIEEQTFAETLVPRGENNFRQKTVSITLQKVEATAAIDPDDY